MNADREFHKTIGFVAAGVSAAVLAMIVAWAAAPADLAEFSDEGEPFFPEFEDPGKATGVRVASYNPEAARTDRFEVKFTPETGWTIPSVYDYPADGEDALSQTAASVVGVRRGGYVPAGPDDFARYGVVDPLDDAAGSEGRGSRVTLLEGDDVLADYIIGRPVEGDESGDGEQLYYVRKADEKRVYRASFDIDLSTRFADWIEPDLLKLGVSDVTRIIVDRYQVDEETNRLNEGDKTRLDRDSPTDDWRLEGLAAGESVNTSAVSQTLTALDDLEIIGVRPMPKFLTAQLKGEELRGYNRGDVAQTQLDLERKGFFIVEGGSLVSNEGDLRVGTRDGLAYKLGFGELFTGSEAVLAGSDDGGDGEEPSEKDESADGTVRGRYLFVTVVFDESLLEAPGEAPVEPEPPAESDGDDSEAAAAAKAEYETAMTAYKSDLAGYEQAKAAYEAKVESGKKKAEELGNRFADWYYVIPAETFEDLALDRADLVDAAEPSEGGEPETDDVAPLGGPSSALEELMKDATSPAADAVSETTEDLPKIDPAAKPGDTEAGDEAVTPVMESVKPTDESSDDTETPADEKVEEDKPEADDAEAAAEDEPDDAPAEETPPSE